MNTKTVFISECERDHILLGLRTGLQVTRKDCFKGDPTNDLFVVLDKLGLLDKNLKNMERSDIMKYECLRKKMKEVRCNAKQLLQSDNISVDEMRLIIRNLNQISRKMKEMSTKLGTQRFTIDDLTDSDTSDHSNISIKKKKTVVGKAEPKKKIPSISTQLNEKTKSAKCEDVKNKPKAVSSKTSKQKSNSYKNKNRGETKCVSRSKLADIFSDQDCSSPSDIRRKKPCDLKGSYITKYSKSNDHQHHCYDGLVLETCSKCLCRRWSIPSVNRNILKNYIKKSIKNNGHIASVSNASVKDCSHSFCKERPLAKKDDYVALPGLIPPERKHMTAVRNKILKENACKSGTEITNKNSSTGCCFNSNTDLEVFETSDTSLYNNEERWDEIFDSCSNEYKGDNYHHGNKKVPVTIVDGATQWDGERSQINIRSKIQTGNSKEATERKDELATDVCKHKSTERDLTRKHKAERVDKCTQSACSKVNKCTSYDNFVLHPQFSWSMPMIGQAFRRSIPLAQEKWRYFDKRGKFIRPSKPSADTGTTTKRPKHTLVMDRSVQTNDMLFTKNMHQVMYLNVVYTKTHLRYIIPNSMEVPILPQTPEVIERRAIDNGYAVTTYKADPDGVIHFTLAYSDGDECKADGRDLPEGANRRLCQLKNLWISSARKFFSQLNEKLGGESGDCEEHNPWSNSLNCSSAYNSSSSIHSDASEASIKTHDTE